jgi:hypothetical protein
VACLPPIPRAQVFFSFLLFAWWPPLLFLVRHFKYLMSALGVLAHPAYPHTMPCLDTWHGYTARYQNTAPATRWGLLPPTSMGATIPSGAAAVAQPAGGSMMSV